MAAWSSVMLALASATPGKAPVVPSRESVMTRLLHDAMVATLLQFPLCTLLLIPPDRLHPALQSSSAPCPLPTSSTKTLRIHFAAWSAPKARRFPFSCFFLASFSPPDASCVRPDPLLLRPDLAGEWVPAAGGGWRWACVPTQPKPEPKHSLYLNGPATFNQILLSSAATAAHGASCRYFAKPGDGGGAAGALVLP